MKITICGLAGTGTSTLGKDLASEFDYMYVSSGDLFRAEARKHNMDLYAFEHLCKINSSYDKSLDKEIAMFGKTHDNFLVESRLAWFFIPDSFKIQVTCNFSTRIQRIAKRDNLSYVDAQEKTEKREQAIRDRYRRLYSLEHFDNPEHFDVVLDSTRTSVPKLIIMLRTLLSEN